MSTACPVEEGRCHSWHVVTDSAAAAVLQPLPLPPLARPLSLTLPPLLPSQSLPLPTLPKAIAVTVAVTEPLPLLSLTSALSLQLVSLLRANTVAAAAMTTLTAMPSDCSRSCRRC